MKNTTKSIYNQAERFATLTKTMIIKGNISRVKKCLAVAENLFVNGSNETKTAVSNVFVYSVSAFMEFHHCSIHDLFPKSLKDEYLKQIHASGI